MFKDSSFIKNNISDISKELFAGGDTPSDSSPVQTTEYRYPVYSNGITNNGLLCYSKSFKVDKKALTISARGTIGFTCIREEYFTPVVRLITLIPHEKIDIIYLKYCIDSMELVKTGSGAGQLTVPDFARMEINVPPIDLQNQFADYVKATDKLKFECLKEELCCLNKERLNN